MEVPTFPSTKSSIFGEFVGFLFAQEGCKLIRFPGGTWFEGVRDREIEGSALGFKSEEGKVRWPFLVANGDFCLYGYPIIP